MSKIREWGISYFLHILNILSVFTLKFKLTPVILLKLTTTLPWIWQITQKALLLKIFNRDQNILHSRDKFHVWLVPCLCLGSKLCLLYVPLLIGANISQYLADIQILGWYPDIWLISRYLADILILSWYPDTWLISRYLADIQIHLADIPILA